MHFKQQINIWGWVHILKSDELIHMLVFKLHLKQINENNVKLLKLSKLIPLGI